MDRIRKYLLRLLLKIDVPLKEGPPNLVRKGELAKEILANPVFKGFIDEAKNRLYREFISSQVMDTAARGRIYDIAKALDLIELQLNRYLSDALIESIRETNKPVKEEVK